jgi:hypothetical protein
MASVCLLAPVPEEHLISALETVKEHGRVVFGSRDWEIFRRLEEIIKPDTWCEALIYASDAQSALNPPTVTWKARYLGHSDSINGRHKEGLKYRPKSTLSYDLDNLGHWAVFWDVSDLISVPKSEYIKISELLGYEKPRRYLKNFIPHGPTIVEKS